MSGRAATPGPTRSPSQAHIHPDCLRLGASTGKYDVRLLDTSAQTLAPTSTATTVSGTITPGTGTNIYRIAGTAGEQITLKSDSFSSTSGVWYLYNPNNNYLAGTTLGSSFSATLPLNGPYKLALEGNDTTDSSISYKFDITATTPAPVTPSGFGTVQSGTLAAGASTSFTFNAPAGTSVYFNNLSRSSQSITATFTDPSNNTIFSYQPLLQYRPVRPRRIGHLHPEADQHQRELVGDLRLQHARPVDVGDGADPGLGREWDAQPWNHDRRLQLHRHGRPESLPRQPGRGRRLGQRPAHRSLQQHARQRRLLNRWRTADSHRRR